VDNESSEGESSVEESVGSGDESDESIDDY
jgi:hypothetical protein